jgi:hypothetical protein
LRQVSQAVLGTFAVDGRRQGVFDPLEKIDAFLGECARCARVNSQQTIGAVDAPHQHFSGIRGPIEEALMGAPIADPTDPVEVGHVARSFDSCLVCTVHAHDARSGKELARFRVG